MPIRKTGLTVLYIILCLSRLDAQYYYSNEIDHKGQNEFSIGIGALSAIQIGKSFESVSSRTSGPRSMLGVYYFTYAWYLSDRVSLGITAMVDHFDGDLQTENGNSMMILGTYSETVFAVMPELKWIYKDRRNYNTYGYLSLGYYSGAEKDNYNANQSIPSNTPNGYVAPTEEGLAIQFTPIGWRVGGKLAGFIELGIGFKGLICGGMSLRL